jgi:ABC-type lipoprotein export system ATPase subunit
MLESIKIDNLFDLYSYSIILNDENKGGLLFVTGPNGIGKTTVLKMINYLYSYRLESFATIPFSKTTFVFSDSNIVVLTRVVKEDTRSSKSDLPGPEVCVLNCTYSYPRKKTIAIETHQWVFRDGDLVSQSGFAMSGLELFMQTEKCLYLPDDRLFRDHLSEVYPEKALSITSAKSYLTQLQISLDDAYVAGDMSSVMPLGEWSETEMEDINTKVQLLSKYGIEIPFDYATLAANNLLIENMHLLLKLRNAFNRVDHDIQLLHSLDDALDNFELIDKRIEYSKRFGYRVRRMIDGRFIDVENLSSGEKHLICQLNMLYFVVHKNYLVMIDEPELSLHMAWQIHYCDWVKELIRLQGIKMLIATHSPRLFDADFSITSDLFMQVYAGRENK